jgi:alkylation response protein AidB-like acyl-CoA dehydrogenase
MASTVRFSGNTHINCSGLVEQGGQYAPSIGTSTRDISDQQDQQERLADFEAALEQARFGTVAGREW